MSLGLNRQQFHPPTTTNCFPSDRQFHESVSGMTSFQEESLVTVGIQWTPVLLQWTVALKAMK